MPLIKRLVTAGLLLALISPIAKSDEDELLSMFGDEEFVSIATGTSQPISRAPAVASVITATDIRRIGATDIDEVLETIPGLHIAYRAVGYAPIYVFRGIYTSTNPQVLMLINGVLLCVILILLACRPTLGFDRQDSSSLWGRRL